MASVSGAAAGLSKLWWFPQWFLALGVAGGPQVLVPRSLKVLFPPADAIWADPFLVERDGCVWLFFEEQRRKLTRGSERAHIAVVQIDESGFMGQPRVALAQPWHLSFPCVVQEDGRWFMVPEQSASKKLAMYECERWPDRWVERLTIQEDVAALDPLVTRHAGLWWLLFTVQTSKGQELRVFHAERLTGPWLPHSGVHENVQSQARQAGQVFESPLGFVRPVQDSSGGVYGRRMLLQKILELTPVKFQEEPVGTIEPSWHESIFATHTYARLGQLIVLDGCRRAPRWKILTARLRRAFT